MHESSIVEGLVVGRAVGGLWTCGVGMPVTAMLSLDSILVGVRQLGCAWASQLKFVVMW